MRCSRQVSQIMMRPFRCVPGAAPVFPDTREPTPQTPLHGYPSARRKHVRFPYEHGALPISVRRVNHVTDVVEILLRGSRTYQQTVRRQEGVQILSNLNLPVGQNHHVVADSLKIGNVMRGEHDRRAVIDHDIHQYLQKLATSKRIEACGRLVEKNQLGMFRQCQDERYLGLLPTRELPDTPLTIDTEPLKRERAKGRSQVWFMRAAIWHISSTDSRA